MCTFLMRFKTIGFVNVSIHQHVTTKLFPKTIREKCKKCIYVRDLKN